MVDRLKEGLINFVSPSKNRRTPTKRDKNPGSISHTLLFRSGILNYNQSLANLLLNSNVINSRLIFLGSADWTSSPKILDTACRSRSEKTLNRKSTIEDSDDFPHYRTPLNSEYESFKKLQSGETGSMGSISR